MKGPLARAALCLVLATSSFPAAEAAGPWRAGPQNTRGWLLMTPGERVEHQRRLRGFTRYEACKTYQEAHQARMTERAREAGVPLARELASACEQLRARGKLR